MNEPANPYQPPTADVNAVAVAASDLARLPNASQGARFLNFIVDWIAQTIFCAVVAFLTAFVCTLLGHRWVMEGPEKYLWGFAGLFVYYVLFETLTGRTIGKLVTGTRVVTVDGGRPTLKQICGRTLARFIPFDAFTFIGREPAGWHDTLTRTRVVRVRQ